MTEEKQNPMHCDEFEALLSEALDSVNVKFNANAGDDGGDGGGLEAVSGDRGRAFQAHAQSCPACGPIFAEAREGMLWLRALEDVRPPDALLHSILAATSGAGARKVSANMETVRASWISRLWRPTGFAMHPRFAGSFAMAFFSLSLTLTLAGVKFKDLAQVDWRPSALSKAAMLQYTQMESKVVRYYNNMRLVYEIESRVGELKKAEERRKDEQPRQQQKRNDKNDTSGRPDQRQDDYSRDAVRAAIASLKIKFEGA